MLDSDNYEDFKEYLHDNGISLTSYTNDLKRMVELVQDFDKLCDDLVAECQFILDNYVVEDEEVTVTQKVKVLKMKGE